MHLSTGLILIIIAGLMTQTDILYSRLRCFLQGEVVSSQCPHWRVDQELQGFNMALGCEGGSLMFRYSCDLGAILISSVRDINWASLERD